MDAHSTRELPVVLTIAGSDSGGGAGIQADLKTFEALGVFGTTAITCLTAQNPDEVTAIEPVAPEMVAQQVRTVCEGFPVAAAKTGMLYSAAIIESVAKVVSECLAGPLVLDPVMVATSGARLLRDDAADALKSVLLPLATVITPNVPELELLCGRTPTDEKSLCEAAAEVAERYGVACIAKGGHLEGDTVTDVLYARGQDYVFTAPRLDVEETHGTGCTFAAAVTALLAGGASLEAAAAGAQAFVGAALAASRPTGGEHTPLAWSSVAGPSSKRT